MSPTLQQCTDTDNLMQSAINAFEEWRATRSRRRPTPDHLWLLVEPLTKHYSINQITKNLRLNISQLKAQLAKISTSEKNVPQLIECTQQLSMLSASHDEANEYGIEFNCKHASSVKLSGLNISELKQVVSLSGRLIKSSSGVESLYVFVATMDLNISAIC